MPRPKLSDEALASLKPRSPAPAPSTPLAPPMGSMSYWLVRWQEPDPSRMERLLKKAHLVRCPGNWREAEAFGKEYVKKLNRLAVFKTVERHEAAP